MNLIREVLMILIIIEVVKIIASYSSFFTNCSLKCSVTMAFKIVAFIVCLKILTLF